MKIISSSVESVCAFSFIASAPGWERVTHSFPDSEHDDETERLAEEMPDLTGSPHTPTQPVNVLAFPPAPKQSAEASEPVAVNIAPARSARNWLTTADLRALLKSQLGLNSRQVTAKCRHSQQYLDLIIRDASVDVAAVQAFAAGLDTWSMDNTDYCSGQSVNVSTTSEVNAIHAAPFLDEARAAVAKIVSGEVGCGTQLANGKYLWKTDQGYYVMRELNGRERGQYVFAWDAENGTEWAISAIALQIARV